MLAVLLPATHAAQQAGPPPQQESSPAAPISARVLLIAAHPDDEDTGLMTWLTRGRNVKTAYLSLTRGDGVRT